MPTEGVSRPEPSPFYNKPTFAALSQAMDDAVRSLVGHEQFEVKAHGHLRNQICLSPRLTQWSRIASSVVKGTEYRIYNISNDKFLSVYEDEVILTTNSNSEEHVIISDETLAATLFKNITTAQEVVQPRKDAEDSDEAFFAPTSDYYQGAGLDAALEESHPDALVEEDAELMEEIVAGEETETGERFWNNSDPALTVFESGQIAVEDDYEETKAVEPEPKKYTGKINKSAAAESYQVKQEYKDKDPVKDCPHMETSLVVNRLKSLQGRLLNIVEASFSDKEQRAAVKTLINKEFRQEISRANHNSGWSVED